MIRNAILLFYIIAAFLLESTLFADTSVFAAAPNILLIITVSIGFLRGKSYGALTGFICGLLYDLVFGPVVGLNALLFVLMGYISGSFCKVFFEDNLRVPVLMTGILDTAYNFIIYILFFLLRGKTSFFLYCIRCICPEVVFTVIMTILLYRLIYATNQLFGGNNDERRRSRWLSS
ncbi:MAG: rod shape-determining protein MreD [Lachnospiraceae bacterium]|nr:rod shape-determining protein MreD [Lachnospiraceae bacterium]